MRVSYPQYLRLKALQEKVIKLDLLIKALQRQYNQQELDQMPQYKRLLNLHQSLTPFLPTQEETERCENELEYWKMLETVRRDRSKSSLVVYLAMLCGQKMAILNFNGLFDRSLLTVSKEYINEEKSIKIFDF